MDRVLFIHIPKNAGMTIRRSPTLSNRIRPIAPSLHISKEYTANVKRTMDALGDHHGYEHARYRDVDIQARSKLRAFCVVRNPYTRTVSRYLFAKKVIEVEKKVPPSYCNVSSFESFLNDRYKWMNMDYMWHRAVRGWYPQLDYIIDENGVPSVDCLRFEHLEDDLARYFNLPSFNDPARNVTHMAPRANYMNFYSDQTKELIADIYRTDFEQFGFDDEGGPATRNVFYL